MRQKEQQEISPKNLWAKLSTDGQGLAIALATGQGLSQGMGFIDAMSKDGDDTIFDVENSMKELAGFELLEEVTFIEEKREQLEEMKKPEGLRALNGDEQKYISLAQEIEDYDKNHGKYLDRYKGWVVPRYRLAERFQSFIDEQFKRK